MSDGLKEVYQAVTVEAAERQLAQFEEAWAASYPVIARFWRQNRARVVSIFYYPEEIRRAVYTTNTVESLNMTLCKVSKKRAQFLEAVFKLLYRIFSLRAVLNAMPQSLPHVEGCNNLTQ